MSSAILSTSKIISGAAATDIRPFAKPVPNFAAAFPASLPVNFAVFFANSLPAFLPILLKTNFCPALAESLLLMRDDSLFPNFFNMNSTLSDIAVSTANLATPFAV